MRRVFGDRFLLITEDNLSECVNFDFGSKEFFFAANPDPKKDSISRITAKSDFIRFKYIEEHGGVWLDADTLVISDFLPTLAPFFEAEKLVWHSEQFFGALPGNPLIAQTVATMVAADRQLYGNPGGSRELVQASKEGVTFVPQSVWDPTGAYAYSASNWQETMREDLPFDEFFRNPDCCLVKMYNSAVSARDVSDFDVETFLKSHILLAQLFRHVEPDVDYWVRETQDLGKHLL